MRLSLVVPALVALAPAGALAVDYMSAEAAAKLLFAEADRFEARDWRLDAAQAQALAAQGLKPRSGPWRLRLAYRGSELLGVVVVDDVLGKFELISYAVGVGMDGLVRGVEILAYRESHGHEVRMPAWRKQFVGKTVGAPLKLGEDIANISGATLSCGHVTEGVKRVVAVVDQARRSGALH
ncbi:FMN-binding protein [Pelomonas sp. CA6]|uniref:FMN-binding protein n=1 Tax=Pelomonas sp. CA6 TaxID=2907999 RepID=UPI001F4C1E1F|nr:FMN-binding protein [Pelomonas sp. CA6]MCH7344946.1 FMN-binding protein [Pelomonas sp. CA6]